MSEDVIGYVIGESSVQQITLLLKQKLRVGQYVVLESPESKILGLITSIIKGSPLFDNDTHDIQLVEQFNNVANIPIYTKAKVKILCDLDNLSQPDQPPSPLTPARLATDNELRKFSANGDIMIGKLIGTNVEVKIDVNALFRHLAILASTGAGKSNTIAVISSRLAEIGGTVLIFDYHTEYRYSDIRKIHIIDPFINPLKLSVSEFARLINIRRTSAYVQYRLLRKSLERFKAKVNSGEINKVEINNDKNIFNKKFEEIVREVAKSEHSGTTNEDDEGDADYSGKGKGNSNNKKSADEVIDKVQEFVDSYSDIINFLANSVVENIRKGMVNIVDIGSLADESASDAVISHYLRTILQSRKDHKNGKNGALEFPIFTVIEEAHVFLSKNEDTLTKHWASKIAREGRKFGVGLIIVSQRPKGLDENILSQMINKIILKIVEPSDQRYVLESSDNLSEDLISSLSSLDVGESLIVGNLTRIPLMVKIDKFNGKLGGGDPVMFKKEDYPPDMPGLEF